MSYVSHKLSKYRFLKGDLVKWDNSTNPPKAWAVEDGEIIFIDPKLIENCRCCGRWFVKLSLDQVQSVCSIGCQLRLMEKHIKE
jgi:hypothetical protein